MAGSRQPREREREGEGGGGGERGGGPVTDEVVVDREFLQVSIQIQILMFIVIRSVVHQSNVLNLGLCVCVWVGGCGGI